MGLIWALINWVVRFHLRLHQSLGWVSPCALRNSLLSLLFCVLYWLSRLIFWPTDALDLSINQLTGSIPSEFGSLFLLSKYWTFDSSLLSLLLSPFWLNHFSHLLWLADELYLYNNQLIGSIPSQVCDLIDNYDLNDLEADRSVCTASTPNCCTDCYWWDGWARPKGHYCMTKEIRSVDGDIFKRSRCCRGSKKRLLECDLSNKLY